jgi:EAL domain-containing protein (putative c-di-GMP-specific phosphodiesterase class I)
MAACSRCSSIPRAYPESGVLRLAPPLAHTHASLRDHLERVGITYTSPAAGLLEFRISGEILERFASGLDGVLGGSELRDTRSLLVSEGASASPTDLTAVQPLSTLVARVQGGWFTSLLRERRLTSVFHPIVTCGAPVEIFGYECLLRGQAADGSSIAPDQLYRAAREADLLFPLDQAARLTAIGAAREHAVDAGSTRIFINFNPSSIYDPVSCLRSTIAAIEQTRFTPDRIVFEVVESDHIPDLAHLVRIIDFYREAGFKVALDDLGSGFGSLRLLEMLRPDFVKLDMGLVRDVDRDRFKAGIVRGLLEMARDLGIASVAEGVETEPEWDWVRRHGADYVQGYFFARPASPPPRLTRGCAGDSVPPH